MRRPWRIAVPVASLRPLGLFWAAILAAAGGGAIALQTLGPPALAPAPLQSPTPVAPTPPAAPPLAEPSSRPLPAPEASAPTSARAEARPGRTEPGPIPASDPALIEPASDVPGGMLPRIAPDGRVSMAVYAHGFQPPAAAPRIGVVVAGLGLNAADSEDAVRALPGAVTLAISPYAARSPQLLDLARATEHELLISVPMEPQAYPMNDPGPQALLRGASAAQNQRRLDWALTRINGYVGATGVLGTLRGERFAGSSEQMAPVLQSIGARGLLYVDPRPGAAGAAGVWGRSIDLVIDEPPNRAEIDAKLAQLEQIARDRGSALGLVGAVRPVTMDRLTAWANGLASRGLVLAPVSALAQPPRTKTGAEK